MTLLYSVWKLVRRACIGVTLFIMALFFLVALIAGFGPQLAFLTLISYFLLLMAISAVLAALNAVGLPVLEPDAYLQSVWSFGNPEYAVPLAISVIAACTMLVFMANHGELRPSWAYD